MSTQPVPLLPMRPLFFEKIWGGHRLSRVEGKGAPEGRPVGESWEVADLEEGESVVAGGPLEGERLGALVERFGAALVGTRAPEGRFPLLVKLIDASNDLSVQVHPGRHNAHLLAGARPKDEAWLILDSDAGGRVLHGFQDGVDEAAFRAAIADGRAHELLRSVPVRPGDVVHVSPGVFHAIGRGVFLLEVQEPSDTTYRVWDFGRKGLDGKPRPLHVDEALTVAAFGPQPAPTVAPFWRPLTSGVEHAFLVDTPGYRLEELRLCEGASIRLSLSGETALVVVALSGRARLTLEGGEPVDLPALHTVVVPASGGALTLSSEGGSTLALAGLGGAPLSTRA